MNVIEQAVREKLRFATVRGALTVEQLFDMPLVASDGFDLDSLSRVLLSDVKDYGQESLVKKDVNVSRDAAELRVAVVKHVIDAVQEKLDEKSAAVAKQQRRQKLLAALETKESEELATMSREDLLEALDE